MSLFTLFNSVSRKPVLRWLVIAVILTALLMVTSRAWSTPATLGVLISDEPGTAQPAHTLALTATPQSFTIAQGGGGSAVIAIDVSQASAPSPRSDVTQAGAPAQISLTASGLPSGITASFTPVDASGLSTLIVTASKDAPTGQVMLTVTAKSGKAAGSATVTVNILGAADPDFMPAVLPGKLSVSQGSDASCEISVSPHNGFSKPVALNAVGVPAGVTAVFEPANITSKSTLHVTATPAAAAGLTPIMIVATAGNVTHTARVLVSVESRPDFSVVTWNDRVSASPGQIGTDTVRISPLNGFTSGVALTASELPPGVSARFSPALAKVGTSTLIVTVDPSVKPGAATFWISSKSGPIEHRQKIALDIVDSNTPSFDVTAWPNELLLIPGGHAANRITVVRNNGFNDLVALSITGLPTGVTASLSPASTRGSSTLTLAAEPRVTIAAPVTIEVSGASGGVTHKAKITLNVNDRRASL